MKRGDGDGGGWGALEDGWCVGGEGWVAEKGGCGGMGA